MKIQSFLSEVKKKIDSKESLNLSSGDKLIILEDLLLVIENGTQFQGDRALKYMKLLNQKNENN